MIDLALDLMLFCIKFYVFAGPVAFIWWISRRYRGVDPAKEKE